MITLILGREGIGGANEDDFDTYVAEHIEEECGLGAEVIVEERGARDVQTDAVKGADEEDALSVLEAKEELWRSWCELEKGGAT